MVGALRRPGDSGVNGAFCSEATQYSHDYRLLALPRGPGSGRLLPYLLGPHPGAPLAAPSKGPVWGALDEGGGDLFHMTNPRQDMAAHVCLWSMLD